MKLAFAEVERNIKNVVYETSRNINTHASKCCIRYNTANAYSIRSGATNHDIGISYDRYESMDKPCTLDTEAILVVL